MFVSTSKTSLFPISFPSLPQLGLLYQSTIVWVIYKQQKFISHCAGGWKFHKFSWRPSSVLCTVEFSCILTWLKLGIRGRHSRGLHAHDLITFPKSHLLIPLHWVLGFQRMNLEGTQTFSPLYSLTSFSSFLSSTLFQPGGGVQSIGCV